MKTFGLVFGLMMAMIIMPNVLADNFFCYAFNDSLGNSGLNCTYTPVVVQNVTLNVTQQNITVQNVTLNYLYANYSQISDSYQNLTDFISKLNLTTDTEKSLINASNAYALLRMEYRYLNDSYNDLRNKTQMMEANITYMVARDAALIGQANDYMQQRDTCKTTAEADLKNANTRTVVIVVGLIAVFYYITKKKSVDQHVSDRTAPPGLGGVPAV